MSIFDKFKTANCHPEMCVSCPERDDDFVRGLAAYIVLAPRYHAIGCSPGPVLTDKLWDYGAGFSAGSIVSAGTAMSPMALPVGNAGIEKTYICGRDFDGIDVTSLKATRTETMMIDGQLSRIKNGLGRVIFDAQEPDNEA